MGVARAQVRAAEQQRFEARSTLDKATIRSPIDGVVIARAIEPGQTVAATFQTPFLLKLARPLDRMVLRILVNEADVGDVACGQDVAFVADAFPDRTFHARVEELRNTPRSVQGAVMYEAVMTAVNEDGSLRPGMTVSARIRTRSVANAITVPNAALRFVPIGREEAAPMDEPAPSGSIRRGSVWVLRGNEAITVSVDIGRSDGRFTAIGAGALSAGDAVIVEQLDRS
jgi:HlyD family secretion protein